MMSNKQKRAKLKARKEANQTKTGYGEVAIDPAKLASTGSYSTPKFVQRGVYLPVSFVCKSCGKEQVWTPHQQKWWYEIAQGNRFSAPKFCRP